MTTAESLELLRGMLVSAGVHVASPRAEDVPLVFGVWRTFGAVTMDDLGRRAVQEHDDWPCKAYTKHTTVC